MHGGVREWFYLMKVVVFFAKAQRLLTVQLKVKVFCAFLCSSRTGFYFFSTAKKSKQKMPPLTRNN